MLGVDHSKPYILVRNNVLSGEECEQLISKIEEIGPCAAPVTTRSGPVLRPEIRNNERVMFDDPILAQLLFERIKEILPEQMYNKSLLGANERIRCYKYKPGMRFNVHADGSFIRDTQERSYYSYLVYLNEGFEGGATCFQVEPEVSITPETGMGLLFQHRILHSGAEVLSGIKYVVRTDIMYRVPSGMTQENIS